MIADTGYGRVFFENAGTTFSKTANQYDAIWILLYWKIIEMLRSKTINGRAIIFVRKKTEIDE